MATFFDSDSDSDLPSSTSPVITRIQPLNARRSPVPAAPPLPVGGPGPSSAANRASASTSRRRRRSSTSNRSLSVSPPSQRLPSQLNFDADGDVLLPDAEDDQLYGGADALAAEEDDMRVLPGTRPEHRALRRLTKAWIGERAAPALLRWEERLVDDVMHLVEQQNEMVTALIVEATEDEHFALMLVQAEMERAKFLLRSYLRTRLAKVEKFAHHITLTPTLHPLLSGLEVEHARKYHVLVAAHYHGSVLSSLPESMRALDAVSNDGTSMVTKPDARTAVFVNCTSDLGSVRLPSGEEADFAKGTTHLVRWGMVEGWVRDKRVQLI